MVVADGEDCFYFLWGIQETKFGFYFFIVFVRNLNFTVSFKNFNETNFALKIG